MFQLQTYIFGKPGNQIVRGHRRNQRQSYRSTAQSLGVTVSDYQDFEAGYRGLSLDRFERLNPGPFQERLCLRVNCPRGVRWDGTGRRCPTLDASLERSLAVSEQISRRTKVSLSPASSLVRQTNRRQTIDDFAGRIRRQLTRREGSCESDRAFYDLLTRRLAQHQIHVLAHPLDRNWWGYSLSPPRSLIVVNRNLAPPAQIYSLIAQLGDLLSQIASSQPIPLAQLDKTVNNFATHFVVPLDDLRQELLAGPARPDRFRRRFRGSSNEIVRRQLSRLRPELRQSRRLNRLVSRLSLPQRQSRSVGDNSLVRRLIDWNGRVYLAELADQVRAGQSVQSLPRNLFGYHPERPAECRVAIQLLDNWSRSPQRLA